MGTITATRRWGILLCSLALCLLTFVAPTPARAAVNPAIRVQPNGLVKSDANGNQEPGVQIRVNEVAQLTFAWDASDPAIGSGDSFEIEYSPYFSSRSPNQEYPINYNGVVIGSCRTGVTNVTCTLNEEYVRQRAAAPLLRGTGSVLLIANRQTTDETVPMKVNGTPVPVDLPGTGGILPAATPQFTPATFTKVATPLGEDSQRVNWSITFNIAHVNQARVAAGLTPIPTDGSISSFTITDALGPGQAIPAEITLIRVVSTDPATRQPVASSSRGSLVAGHMIALRTVSGSSAQITVTAPFQADANYSIAYLSPIVDADGNQQKAKVGVRYTNTARLDGTDAVASAERVLTESFGIQVTYQPGYGGFRVIKTLGGTGASQIPNTTGFPVTATYTLPANTTVDSYPGWTPPGTLNPTRTGGTFTYQVKPGGNTPWNGSLPHGTRVTLSEDPAAAQPQVKGVEWSTPQWRLGTATTNTFTIVNRQLINLQLDNTATLATGGFTVAKTVSGENGAGRARQYTFRYTCGQITGTVQAPGDGTPVNAGVQIPLNVDCTVTEDAATAEIPGYSLTAAPPQTLTIASRTTPTAFTFSNVYAQHTGTFQVVKRVSGAAAAASKTFTFDYTCSNGRAGQLRAAGNATPVGVGAQLPVGTTCEVREDPASAALNGHTWKPVAPQTVTITANGQLASVEFLNEYTPAPPATPSVAPTPTAGPQSSTPAPALPDPATPSVMPTITAGSQPSNPRIGKPTPARPRLADTGSEIGLGGIAAAVGLVGAGGLLIWRRRV